MPIWRPFLATLLALAALITTTPPADAGGRNARNAPTGWTLSWQDEFNGSMKPAWSIRGTTYVEGRTRSKGDWRAVKLTTDGKLALKVIKDPDRPGSYLNGHIGTQGTASWSAGSTFYAEARIKFQPLNGSHGAFWLLSPTGADGRVDSLPEVDVAEYFGVAKPWLNESTRMDHHVYWRAADGSVAGSHRSTWSPASDPWGRDYHQYGVLRSPGSECWEFYIDDVFVKQSCPAIRDGDPKFLVLSLLTKDFELDKLQLDKLDQMVMKVDWVRVYIP